MRGLFRRGEKRPAQDKKKESGPAVCPYCKKALDKVPQRKKKCPFCKNFIYVRTSPSTRKRVLVTEDEAKKIELEWEKVHSVARSLSALEQYGITEREFNARKNKLSRKLGREANDRDVVWSIFNELITKTRDLQKLKTIYYEMALFLNEKGRDAFKLLQQSAKMGLMHLRQEGVVKKVSISTARENSCEACQKLEGKVYTVERALKEMPIPCRDCTYELYSDKVGFCRCMYFMELD